MDTVVGWRDGHADPLHRQTAGRRRSPRSAPTLADLPGLGSQAQELTELLDLGFHHGEVLGRLGTTVSLGVLLTGPAGSGKSALVRAVAAEVGAGGHPAVGAGDRGADQQRRGRAAAPGRSRVAAGRRAW